MRRVIAGIISSAVAFGSGYLLGRQPAPVPDRLETKEIAVPCPAVEPAPVRTIVTAAPTVIAPPAPAPVVATTPPPVPPEVAKLAFENTQLRQQVASFEAKLDVTRKENEATQGLPIAPPPKLDQRFAQETLQDSITRAFSESGLAGAISSVDCTEYPCIVYGEGKGGPDEFRKLMATGAMRAYAEDSHNAFGWSMGDGSPEHPRKDYLGLAIYPDDDSKARGEELRKRIKYRSSEMAATFEKP